MKQKFAEKVQKVIEKYNDPDKAFQLKGEKNTFEQANLFKICFVNFCSATGGVKARICAQKLGKI